MSSAILSMMQDKIGQLKSQNSEKPAVSSGDSSTNILGQVADSYAPAMDELKEQRDSTELVDRATNTSQSRFDRGVQAGDHIAAAQGGLTTRQAALGKYQSKQAGAANMDANINSARLNQNELRENATSGLAGIQRSILGGQLDEARHRENLDMQRDQHKDRMRQAELDRKANEPGFFGKIVSMI